MIHNQTTIKIYHTNTNKKNEFLTVDISSLTKEKQLLFLEMSKYPNENTEFKERFKLEKDGDSLRLPVSWGDYMKFEVGDYITSKGYTLNNHS